MNFKENERMHFNENERMNLKKCLAAKTISFTNQFHSDAIEFWQMRLRCLSYLIDKWHFQPNILRVFWRIETYKATIFVNICGVFSKADRKWEHES